MSPQKILVVDDEEDICEILTFNLQNEEYKVTSALSGEDALKIIKEDPMYNLIILDVMMGGVSGYKVADKIRNDFKLEIPIIFLTAKITENDLLTGFSVGCDDYITKPFSIKEIIARVKALINRSKTKQAEESIIKIGELEINTIAQRIFYNDEEIILTKKEYEILNLLASSNNHTFSREEILHKIWNDDIYVLERTVDVHITRLRKKLNKFGIIIKNRSGYGYNLDFIK